MTEVDIYLPLDEELPSLNSTTSAVELDSDVQDVDQTGFIIGNIRLT